MKTQILPTNRKEWIEFGICISLILAIMLPAFIQAMILIWAHLP